MADPRPSLLVYAEALFALSSASLLARLLGFERVARLVTARGAGAGPGEGVMNAAIRRTLEAWSRRVPFRSKCLEQGIAATWMMSRRHRRANLFYGAAMIDGELKAHVWVRSGDLDVIGCENAGDFAILSQFSNAPSSSPVHS